MRKKPILATYVWAYSLSVSLSWERVCNPYICPPIYYMGNEEFSRSDSAKSLLPGPFFIRCGWNFGFRLPRHICLGQWSPIFDFNFLLHGVYKKLSANGENFPKNASISLYNLRSIRGTLMKFFLWKGTFLVINFFFVSSKKVQNWLHSELFCAHG